MLGTEDTRNLLNVLVYSSLLNLSSQSKDYLFDTHMIPKCLIKVCIKYEFVRLKEKYVIRGGGACALIHVYINIIRR